LYKIAKYLNKHSIPTPRTVSGARNAGTLWHQSSVRIILENPTYTGRLIQHREEMLDFITKGRKSIDEDKQIVTENAHPAIITVEEHKTVLAKMRKKGERKRNGQESTFAHITICADCGKGMTFRTDRGKGSSGAYVCGGYVKHSKNFCSSHLIEAENLTEVVKAELNSLIGNHVKLEKVYQAACGEIDTNQARYSRELKATTRRLAKLADTFQSLFGLYSQKEIAVEQFQMQNDILLAEQHDLLQRKAELENKLADKEDIEQNLKGFEKQIRLISQLDINDLRILKMILHKLVQKVVISADGFVKQIVFNFSQPALVGA
jgi:hypothetical protein